MRDCNTKGFPKCAWRFPFRSKREIVRQFKVYREKEGLILMKVEKLMELIRQ